MSEKQVISPRRGIFLASFVSLITGTQLVTFNSYVGIFLEEDLFTAAIIIALVLSIRNFLQLFFRIPLGELSQIIGRKPLILLGNFCFSVALLILFISFHWVHVLIATTLLALGMSAFWPALFAHIADFTPDKVGESNGRIFQALDIGVIIASLTAKVMLDGYFIELRQFFIIIGGFGIIMGIVSIIILPEGLVKEKRKQVESIPRALYGSIASMFASLYRMSRMAGMLEIYSFQLLVAFLEYSTMVFFPFLIVNRGFSKGTVSEILLWSTLILLWFKPLLGRSTDKLPFTLFMTTLLFISGITLVLTTTVNDVWLFVICYIVFSACIITCYTALNGETSRRAPAAHRGVSLGVLGFYISLGRTISTVSLGPIWEISLEAVFYAAGFSVILISVFLFIIYYNKSNKTNKKFIEHL
jgi:MFS family permease